MANGTGEPQPKESPLPKEQGTPGTSSGEQRKSEKCRKTQIVRVYDETGKYWVDVEVMKNASFIGSQWSGPLYGNRGEETITQLAPQKLQTDGSCGDVILIGLNPDKPITGENPSGGGEGSVEQPVPSRKSSKFESRHGVNRKFSNNRKDLTCCKDMKRRVKFNEIDPKKFVEGQPPSNPKDYKQAVVDTDDGADLFLDLCIPESTNMDRALTLRRQTAKPSGIWGGGDNALPGASRETDAKGPHFKLDPYQVVVNFGPDALAVEFYDGEGPPVEEKK